MNSCMKKFFASMVLGVIFLMWFLSMNEYTFAAPAKVTQNDLLIGGGDNSATNATNVTFRENFLKNIQRYMMGLLWIVSVSVFLYIGYTLFTAQGKEEEFKNAWKALVYAAIGLAVIPLAFVAVKIVTGFTF